MNSLHFGKAVTIHTVIRAPEDQRVAVKFFGPQGSLIHEYQTEMKAGEDFILNPYPGARSYTIVQLPRRPGA